VYHTPSLDRRARRAVAQEISIHGRLMHPHILGMYAAFQDQEHLCIVSG